MENRGGGKWSDKILHAVFEGPDLRLCGSDGPDSEPMKGCALYLEIKDASAAKTLFDKLSAGGRVTVPFKLQFWGDTYGNFTGAHGVQWAILSPAAK
jgi:PhnB protein